MTPPSPKRAVVEWLGACGLYLALVALFTNLSLRAQESGSTAALVAFGFLLALFGSGLAQALGIASWALMAISFIPTLRFYRMPLLWGAALPAISLIYLAFTIDSAVQHARRGGGMWKGRVPLRT